MPSVSDKKRQTFLSKFTNVNSFCSAYAPSEIIRLTNDVERCYSGNSPTLVDLKIMYGDGADAKWLGLVLAYVNELPLSNKRMEDFQISAAAASIASTFYFLKASEVLLFFRNLMGGKYGKILYGGIDGHAIGAAIRDHFLPERAVWMERLAQRQRDEEWQEHLQESVHDPEKMNAIVERLARGLRDDNSG